MSTRAERTDVITETIRDLGYLNPDGASHLAARIDSELRLWEDERLADYDPTLAAILRQIFRGARQK